MCIPQIDPLLADVALILSNKFIDKHCSYIIDAMLPSAQDRSLLSRICCVNFNLGEPIKSIIRVPSAPENDLQLSCLMRDKISQGINLITDYLLNKGCHNF